MNDNVTSIAPHHLGMPGINSHGYAPREGTKEHSDAVEWTKNYWKTLLGNSETKKD